MLFNNDQLDELLELGQGDVAEFCDSYFNVVTLSKHMERMEPFGRKDLCGYLGIGESTMTGWLKEHRIPLVAKEALMLPLVLRLLRNEIRRLRDDGRDMRILRNGDIYQICRFMPDECGEAIGEVVTDKIVDLQQARTLLAGQRALKLLGKLNETAIQYVLEMTENESFREDMEELEQEVKNCRLYAFDYDKWKKQDTPVAMPANLEELF